MTAPLTWSRPVPSYNGLKKPLLKRIPVGFLWQTAACAWHICTPCAARGMDEGVCGPALRVVNLAEEDTVAVRRPWPHQARPGFSLWHAPAPVRRAEFWRAEVDAGDGEARVHGLYSLSQTSRARPQCSCHHCDGLAADTDRFSSGQGHNSGHPCEVS